jgi:hypothetical protein
MALQAQRPDIGEIAFASTLGNRSDMVGIPQAGSPQALQAQVAKHAYSSRRPEPLDAMPLCHRVQSARGADTFVAFKHLVPQVSRIGAQPPFVNAPIGAEGPPPDWNLQAAPSAQDSAPKPARQFRPLRAATAHRAILTQRPRID